MKICSLVEFTFIRHLSAILAHLDEDLHEVDVVKAFSNGELEDDVYKKVPEGENGVYRKSTTFN